MINGKFKSSLLALLLLATAPMQAGMLQKALAIWCATGISFSSIADVDNSTKVMWYKYLNPQPSTCHAYCDELKSEVDGKRLTSISRDCFGSGPYTYCMLGLYYQVCSEQNGFLSDSDDYITFQKYLVSWEINQYQPDCYEEDGYPDCYRRIPVSANGRPGKPNKQNTP